MFSRRAYGASSTVTLPNADGYFAVTGHWIEEPQTGVWELKSALLGFVRLNTSHDGRRLGGALFKIVDRLGISHKVDIVIFTILYPNNYLLDRPCHL